jgi:hypothetical protein
MAVVGPHGKRHWGLISVWRVHFRPQDKYVMYILDTGSCILITFQVLAALHLLLPITLAAHTLSNNGFGTYG